MKHLTYITTLILASLTMLSSLWGSNLQSLVQDREEKETTVWRQETLAQEYEEAFIRLWDELRNSDEPESVFKAFSFNSIKTGKLSDPVTLDHGIISRTMGTADHSIPFTQWTGWLEQLEEMGNSLYQTEWHHKQFMEKADAQNESIFSFTLHVEHKESKLRIIADGRILVVWKDEKSTDGIYVPDTIEVTELEILQRQGEPLFKRLGSFDIPPQKRGPVLAYDLDMDGYSEILMPTTNQIAWNNQGNGYRLESLNPVTITSCRSAVLGDFDRNGTTDLVIDGSVLTKDSARKQVGMFIFKGSEKGTFEAGPQPLVIDPLFRVESDTTLTAGDIDGDGDLDLWLGQYKEPYIAGNMPIPFFNSNDGHPSYLLINDGDGVHFKEKTRELGITEKQFRRVYSSSFFDCDDDGDLDLLNICDFSGVDLFRNDGKGNFEDITDEAIDVRFLFGMAHSFADFNYDGRLDFYSIGMSSTTASRLHKMGAQPDELKDLTEMRIPMTFGNRLYYSQPDGSFKQPSHAGQVARTGWSWGVVTVDFDNDGDIEFYVANGHDSNTTARDYCTDYWTDDIYRGTSIENPLFDDYFDEKLSYKEEHGISWNGFEHNFLYMPMSEGRARNVSFLAGVALERDSRMVIADDVNMDGKLDLIIDSNPPDWNPMTDGSTLEVYLNQIPSTGNFVGVRLQDKEGAPSSTAAKIVVSYGGRTQAAANVNGDSFETQHAAIRHFGIGTSDTVDYIEVTWMDGSKRRIDDPAINQYHLIDF
jgi:hypothetical protein